jgi:CubicO group peptidase (beta-lactamase class C family)
VVGREERDRGLGTLADGTVPDSDTVYEIGSVTKTIRLPAARAVPAA